MLEKTPEAPHGYGPDGKPLAPFGFKADGTPKKDNRGRAPGTRVPGPKKNAGKKTPQGRTQAETKQMLLGLADVVSMPLVGASRSPLVKKRIGERQAMALSGDAVIFQSHAPQLADVLIEMSQTKPGLLAFLDTVEEKAPYFALMQVGMSMTKAFVQNHMSPDERLANAGQTLAAMRAAQMAEEIERQAAAMGVQQEAQAA